MAKEERGIQKKGSFHFRKMFDINPVRQAYNFVHENGYGKDSDDKTRNNLEDSPESSPVPDEQMDTAMDNKIPDVDSVSVSASSPPLMEEASAPTKRDSPPTGILSYHIASLIMYVCMHACMCVYSLGLNSQNVTCVCSNPILVVFFRFTSPILIFWC